MFEYKLKRLFRSVKLEKPFSKRLFWPFLTYMGVVVLLSNSVTTYFNQQVLDLFQGVIQPRNEIVIVAIDDSSLQALGSWPWQRDIFAKAIETISDEEAAVIGVDILFLEDREGDKQLESEFKRDGPPIVLAQKITEQQTYSSILKSERTSNGFINFIPDFDGKVRNTPITYFVHNQCLKSFAFELIRHYFGDEDFNCGDASFEIGSERLINDVVFSYSNDNYSTVSFIDVIKGNYSSDQFKNKIVLIGVTSTDLSNNVSDNVLGVTGDRIPGTLVHANIINSFLEGSLQIELPYILYLIFEAALGIALLYIFYYGVRTPKIILIVLLTQILNIFFAAILYEFGISWVVFHTSILIFFAYGIYFVFQNFAQGSDYRYLKELFSSYVNPALLPERNGDSDMLGGENRVLTVMVSDVRDFTTLSEKLDASSLLNLLNDYITTMVAIIRKYQGTVDKFMGDGIMAFWNAPEYSPLHKENAVMTALEMNEKIKIFNAMHENAPEFKIGVGLHTGSVIVGNIGTKDKLSYTIIGDAANLTARLEGLTKMYGCPVIVSENVVLDYNYPYQNNSVIFRELDTVIVKGKESALKIYEPMVSSKETIHIKEFYEDALNDYYNNKFKTAKAKFTTLYKSDKDKPSKLMIERIKTHGDELVSMKGVWKWEIK